jgi:5-methylcytosine-specific restriction protein A
MPVLKNAQHEKFARTDSKGKAGILNKLDYRSEEAAAYRSWYKSKEWRGKHGLRAQQLAKQPLCERCYSRERILQATVVNHRKPHKGDINLFRDPKNLQSLCAPCHDGSVQREEARGHQIGNDLSGRPIDTAHPWNR